MALERYRLWEPLTGPDAPPLSEDIRTLLTATAIDVCEATGVPFCGISQLRGTTALLAAAQGGGPALSVGGAWTVQDIPPAQQAVATGRVVLLTTRDDPRLTPTQRTTLTGHAEFFGLAFVPLLARTGVKGLLVLGDHRPRDLSAQVVRVAPVVRLAAQVLEQHESLEDLARSADDLSLVLDADVEAQSRSGGPGQVLRVVARRLASLCDAPMVRVSAVQDEEVRTLVSWRHGRLDRERPVPASRYTDRPLTSAVIATGRAETVASLEDPRLAANERVALKDSGAQSSLMLPLLSNGRVIGIAEILDSRPRDFSESRRPALALCEIAAHMLDKAMLLDSLEQISASLREIVTLGAHVTADHDPRRMATFVAERLLHVLDATACEIHRTDQGRVSCLASLDRRGPQDAPTVAASATDRWAPGPNSRAHDILVLADAGDPRLTAQERAKWLRDGFASQLTVPLVAGERLVGLIDVFDVRSRSFADHLDFARAVAQLMAAALNGLRLHDRLRETDQQLAVLSESSLEFGASLDLTDVLRSVASRMCLAAPAARCAISALEHETLHGLVSTDGSLIDDQFTGTSTQLGDCAISRRAVELGHPVVVADIAEDPRMTSVERLEGLRGGFSTLVALPLMNRGAAIGVATLFGLDDADAAPTHLLRGLAQIAAQAIANARMCATLDDGAARLRRVNEAGLELASNLDLNRVFEAAARRLCHVAGVDSCDVYTLEGRDLLCVASVVREARDEDWRGSRLTLDDWRASRLAVESRSVVRAAGRERTYVDTPAPNERRTAMHNAALIVPLLVEDRVIGVIEVCDSTLPRDFTQDDVASVEAVCRVAAMAIANAGLYHDAQLRTRESELLNTIAARTGSSLDTSTIARATVEELATLVPFTAACLTLESHQAGWEVAYSTSPLLEALAREAGAAEEDALETLRRERVMTIDLSQTSGSTPNASPDLGAALLIGVFIDDALSGALALGAPDRNAFAGADGKVLMRVGALLALAFKNARLYETIKNMHVANLKALISALNARDYYAVGHAARVAGYMLLLGRELGWPPGRLQQITEAAFLHDVGRIGISDNVLYKPGRLTDQESAELRRHPLASAEIIQPLFSPDIVRAIRHHHERWDGAGYPHGLAGENIPPIARALCIVDSYDAMSFQRQHHEALSYAECLSELDRCRGTQFDPDMVTAFMRVLDRLDERRLVARAASGQAATLVEPALLAALRTRDDESTPEHQKLAKVLREVRDMHDGVRFLTAIAPGVEGWRMVCDPEEDPALRLYPGDRVDRSAVAEDALVPEADRNVLHLDDFGVWVSGATEIRGADGTLIGLACADLAPADDWPAELGTSGSSHDRAFSAIVESATARLGRARVDAVTDGLTGLYNQRYFKQRLAEEIARAAEQDRPLSLLFCDLDRFKRYNDRLGHVAGDKALRAVAGVILHSIRQVDLAARYGGEELAVILIDTPGDSALEVAERIRQGVADLDLGPDRGITASIGAAAFPDHATRMEELIDKADWAMYLAKRRGRNRADSFGRARENEASAESTAPMRYGESQPG
jgi:diguanylate cyclase (GGDEF)-like protein